MYVIDFDDCIFDGKSFKSFLFNIKGTENYESLKMNYDHIKAKYGYNNFEQRKKLCDITKEEEKCIEEKIPEFIYEDFFEFLEKTNEKIIVLSFGNTEFQLTKIQKSGITKNITTYILTEEEDKKEEIKNIYEKFRENIIYVDDRIFITSEDFDFEIKILKIDRNGKSGNISNFKELLEIQS